MKKFFAVVLALCMVLGMTPAAFAAERYTDVSETDWYYDEIDYVTEQGLMDGVTDTAFDPGTAATRADVMVALYRMEGSPEPTCPNPFPDVAEGDGDTDEAIVWASCVGLVTGYPDGTAQPDGQITRQELATLLYRYYQYKGYDLSASVELPFDDADEVGDWALTAMKWAVAEGIFSGVGNNLVDPQGTAERSHVAALLYKALARKHTVTFDANWSRGEDTAVSVADGEKVTKPANPTRSGYSFGGWYTKSTGGTRFSFSTPITEDITLYARWYAIHYCSYGDWTSNDDGTHTRSCSCGSTETADCTFEYVNNNDGTHTEVCSDCNYVKVTEAHTYDENNKCVCGDEITVENGVTDPVAVIGTTGYATLDEALTAAVADDIVILMKDIEATAQISVEKAITINGNGKTIKANNADWPNGGDVKMLMSINGTSDVTVANLTLDSNGQAFGLQAFESTNVILEGVTTQNSKGAGLTVNDSTVTATDLTAAGNTWGSVNVDKGTPKFTLNSGTLSDALQIWSELKDASVVTADGYYTVDGGTFYIWTNDATELVAKIGGVYYQTLEAALATATDSDPVEIEILETGSTPLTTNFEIPGGRNITLRGATNDPAKVVLQGQIATTTSTAGTLTIKDVTILVNDQIVDQTSISQTGSSAIALWGNQTVSCENVVFDMSLSDSSAITGWWDTGVGTTIIVKDCTFNCNGQRPIRTCGNLTVENCTFNDPYRYAVQLTAKASTATELENAIVTFKNNTINNGASGKAFVYGIQLEGADYGCHDLIINGSGNTINAGEWDTSNESTMYYCECGKVDHATITWNTEAPAAHEDTAFIPVAKIDGVEYASLQDALTAVEDGETITLLNDTAVESATTAPYGNKYALKMDGGILDGKDYELTMECYGDDYGIMTSGGTVKNLTIEEGCRAIMIMSPTEDIILDKVHIGGDGVLYPINTGEAGAEGVDLIVSNSTLKGWTSFAGIESASFTSCTFGQGTYYNDIRGRVLRPYVNTTITNCSFIEHMNLDLSKLGEGQKVTIDNCTVNGQPVTAAVFTVVTDDEQYDTELFTVDLPSWATSLADCVIIDGKIPVAEGFVQDPESGEYEITSAAGLFNFAKQVNENNNSFSGKTVKLMANIDLENADWEPIGQTGATTFAGNFDGQNYTISNLKIDSSDQTGAHYSSALFGWIEIHGSEYTMIENINVVGANVAGHHNCGVIVGYATGSVEIKNCSVSNAAISCTNANDDANGDKAGVIAGNVTAEPETKVTDCSASESTVTAYRDAGQVVGAALTANVTGCTATNVTVSGTADSQNSNITNDVIGRVLG